MRPLLTYSPYGPYGLPYAPPNGLLYGPPYGPPYGLSYGPPYGLPYGPYGLTALAALTALRPLRPLRLLVLKSRLGFEPALTPLRLGVGVQKGRRKAGAEGRTTN